MSLQGKPDRIIKCNIDGETIEESRIVRGVLCKIGVGDVNIHVRGDNTLFLQRKDDDATD
jgi:hypothetical protein